ncbi:helix-turn-helix domain-containing protein [Clostridioides difficile]|nr:helix-turn-helix transcriptional regulator [Clostridioides difficile]HBH3700793.1 helix-turn-helix transcriptional regulator [Clostridioides difficile]HBH4023426.1 helix-turn-helix transcriptional regulator [Clostridioides difficile]HCU2594737.1 helix-turn-helix transcriptional regulator [Clostridioides difficile]
MNFAHRLKSLREEKDVKQVELAKVLKLTSATLSQYEKGIREPNNDTLSKLAEYFNVSTDYLLGRTNIRNTTKSAELEIIEKLNFSDDIKEALRMISELSPANQEKMMKIAKVFLEEEINEKK